MKDKSIEIEMINWRIRNRWWRKPYQKILLKYLRIKRKIYKKLGIPMPNLKQIQAKINRKSKLLKFWLDITR